MSIGELADAYHQPWLVVRRWVHRKA